MVSRTHARSTATSSSRSTRRASSGDMAHCRQHASLSSTRRFASHFNSVDRRRPADFGFRDRDAPDRASGGPDGDARGAQVLQRTPERAWSNGGSGPAASEGSERGKAIDLIQNRAEVLRSRSRTRRARSSIRPTRSPSATSRSRATASSRQARRGSSTSSHPTRPAPTLAPLDPGFSIGEELDAVRGADPRSAGCASRRPPSDRRRGAEPRRHLLARRWTRRMHGARCQPDPPRGPGGPSHAVARTSRSPQRGPLPLYAASTHLG